MNLADLARQTRAKTVRTQRITFENGTLETPSRRLIRRSPLWEVSSLFIIGVVQFQQVGGLP